MTAEALLFPSVSPAAKIRSAAVATWEYVASDAYQLEGFGGTVAEKTELAMDANRVVDIGRLDKTL